MDQNNLYSKLVGMFTQAFGTVPLTPSEAAATMVEYVRHVEKRVKFFGEAHEVAAEEVINAIRPVVELGVSARKAYPEDPTAYTSGLTAFRAAYEMAGRECTRALRPRGLNGTSGPEIGNAFYDDHRSVAGDY